MHFVGLVNMIAESKAGNTASPLLAEFLGGGPLFVP